MPLVTLHRMSDDEELDFEANVSGFLSQGDILTWAGGSEVRVAAIIDNGVGTVEAVQTTLANMPVLDASTSKPRIEYKADTSLSATLPSDITGAIIVVADETGVYQLTDDIVAGALQVQNTLGFQEMAILAADTPSADVDAVIANMKETWLAADSWLELTVRTTTASESFTISCQNVGLFRANIDWGDGSSSTITSYNDADLAHTYAVAGDYTVTITGQFPNVHFNNEVSAPKVIAASLNGNQIFIDMEDAFLGCSLSSFDSSGLENVINAYQAWRNNSLTSFNASGLTSAENLYGAWRNNNLTSFDASALTSAERLYMAWRDNDLTSFDASGLTNATEVSHAWSGNNFTSFDASSLTSVVTCANAWNSNQLTSFDASPLTNAVSVYSAWSDNNLTSFDTSSLTSVTNCAYAWRDNSLTSFNASGLTSVTNCVLAWYGNDLTSFDASGLATMGVPVDNCFLSAWTGGTNALNAASVESILTNIDASGQSAPAVGPDISISSDGDPLTSAAATAVTNLKAKGWTITINGVAQ